MPPFAASIHVDGISPLGRATTSILLFSKPLKLFEYNTLSAALAVTVKPAKADADIAAAQSNEISFLLFISSLPFFP